MTTQDNPMFAKKQTNNHSLLMPRESGLEGMGSNTNVPLEELAWLVLTVHLLISTVIA